MAAGLLILIVFSLPYVLSTRTVTRKLTELASETIKGSVQIEALSLSWLGPCRVRNLRASDPTRRQVLAVDEVLYPGGLWHMITGPMEFGRVVIRTPEITLYLDEGGRTSLSETFKAKEREPKPKPERPTPKPEKPKPTSEPERPTLPRPRGQIRIQGGLVKLVRPDGRVAEFREIHAHLDVATLDALTGNMSVALPEGGKVTGSFRLSGLAEDGQLAPEAARGEFELATQEPIRIGPLLNVAGLAPSLDAQVGIKVSGNVRGRDVSAKYNVTAEQLRSTGAKGLRVQPTDLALSGEVLVSQSVLRGDAGLHGQAGQVRTQFSYQIIRDRDLPDLDKLLEAILAGRPASLPSFSMTADGRMDLARLARSIPTVMKLKRGVEVTGGQVSIEGLAVTGGGFPTVKGTCRLDGLAAVKDGRRVACEPVSITVDAGLQKDKGLVIREASFRSQFAAVDASGDPQNLRADFRANLKTLVTRFGSIFDLQSFPHAGALDGRLTMRRTEKGRIDIAGRLDARGIAQTVGGRTVHVEKAGVTHQGYLLSDGQTPVEFVLTAARAEVGEDLLVSASGSHSFKSRSTDLQINLARADLASLLDRARAWGVRSAPDVTGVVSCGLRATLGPEKRFTGSVTGGSATGIAVRKAGAAVPQTTLDFRFSGSSEVVGRQVRGDLTVNGDALALSASASLRRPTHPIDLRPPDLLGALLEGRKLSLPDFELAAKGRFDMGTIGRAIPQAARPRPELLLQRGNISLKSLKVRGGSYPQIEAAVDVTDLALARADKPVSLAAVRLVADAGIEKEDGLHIRKIQLRTPLARLESRGTTRELTADFTVNLLEASKLARDLRGGKSAVTASGDLAGTLNVNTSDRERFSFAMNMTGKDVALQTGKRKIRYDGLSISQRGALQIKGLRPSRLDLRQLEVQIPSAMSAGAHGQYDFASGAYQTEATIARADLAALGSWARAFGTAFEADRYAGALTASVRAAGARGKQISSDGQAALTGLRLDDQPIGKEPIQVRWKNLTFSPSAKHLQVALASLQGSMAHFEARQLNVTAGKEIRAAGRLTARADIEACLKVARPFLKRKELPAVTGRFTWNAGAGAAEGTVTLAGKGSIRDLTIGTGKKAFREAELGIEHRVSLAQDGSHISLERFTVASKLLAVELAGRVARPREDCVLDLRGRYSGSWEGLLGLAKQLSPKGTEGIAITGTSSGEILVQGPLRKAKAKPPFRDLVARTEFGWSSATVQKVPFGRLTLPISLREAQVVIPETVLASGNGKVRLIGTVDCREKEPRYVLLVRRKLIEELEITPELGRQLLSRFNPVFGGLAGVEGLVTLEVTRLSLPLAETIKTRGRGAGSLDLRKLKVRPAGLLATLMKLRYATLQDEVPVTTGLTHFYIEKGRIYYDSFTMTLPDGFTLIFHGSVGFDDTVDLVVSVPVTPALLDKVGVGGRMKDYADALAGIRVDVPVVGSRLEPRLDFTRVDVSQLTRRLMEMLLRDKLRRGAGLKVPPPSSTRPSTQPKRRFPFLDAIPDLRKRQREQEN